MKELGGGGGRGGGVGGYNSKEATIRGPYFHLYCLRLLFGTRLLIE